MIEIEIANHGLKEHQDAIIFLLDNYMHDDMGNRAPMPEENKVPVLQGLASHRESFVLLAKNTQNYVGMASCFVNFSTFRARPLINIHDLIVVSGHRNKGIGRQLLRKVQEIAEQRNCCKITLEVRVDNHNAKHLYASEEYREGEPPMHFWSKTLQ